MSRAVYPGSFDPMTLGHLDIISRLTPLFDELIVLVSSTPNKKYLFSTQERKQIIEDCLKKEKKVRVEIWDGLTVDYCEKNKIPILIRGLRAVSDFDHEMIMANMNRRLKPKIETFLVYASAQFGYLSSSIVKEVAASGGTLTDLVPEPVEKALKVKFKGEVKS